MSSKFTWKGYWKPTPLILRKIGDALLAVFSMLSVSSIATDHKYVGIATLVIGVLGKILSNFFSENTIEKE